MQFISQYYSDDEEEQIVKDQNTKNDTKPIILNLPTSTSIKEIESAPNVSIENLVNKKNEEASQNFNSGFYVPEKKNHVTGYINHHTMNDFNFKEQYYTYNAFGFAQDPTDFSQNKIIGNQAENNCSVFEGGNSKQKEYKKILKCVSDKPCDLMNCSKSFFYRS